MWVFQDLLHYGDLNWFREPYKTLWQEDLLLHRLLLASPRCLTFQLNPSTCCQWAQVYSFTHFFFQVADLAALADLVEDAVAAHAAHASPSTHAVRRSVSDLGRNRSALNVCDSFACFKLHVSVFKRLLVKININKWLFNKYQKKNYRTTECHLF